MTQTTLLVRPLGWTHAKRSEATMTHKERNVLLSLIAHTIAHLNLAYDEHPNVILAANIERAILELHSLATLVEHDDQETNP